MQFFFYYSVVSSVSQSDFSSEDWTLGAPGGTTPQAIQSNFSAWLSGSQSPGLIVLEHELTNASVQAFMAAYPVMKQYNWSLKSTATLEGLSPYQNDADDEDTSQPTSLPLTAGGLGGVGLTATGSPSSSTSKPPSSTSSGNSSKATALPDSSNTKNSGAAPGLNLSPVASLLSTLALVFSLCLI